MVSMFPAAVDAVRRGLHVFPCEPLAKLPAITDPPYRLKWPRYATNDLLAVAGYWQVEPEANVGVACKPSGILVVDCDMPKTGQEVKGTRFEYLMNRPGHVDGTDVLREICGQHGQSYDDLLRTYSVCTTRMGLHLYFRWPTSIHASQASLLPGLLDIRCNGGTDGGYVIGAGSTTPRGDYTVENDAPIADCPPWLVELCTNRPDTHRAPDLPFRRALGGNIQGLADKVSCAAEGNRSHTLYWAACAAAVDRIPLDEAMDTLAEAARRCGLTEFEARGTIASAYRRKGT